MDFEKAKKICELADKQIELCKEYQKERERAGKNKCDLDILLIAKLPEIRQQKPNVGYDMAILMLLEIEVEARAIYREMCDATAKYKGLEKLIDAHQSNISLEQSIMKYVGQGEKYGA